MPKQRKFNVTAIVDGKKETRSYVANDTLGAINMMCSYLSQRNPRPKITPIGLFPFKVEVEKKIGNVAD